MSIHETEREVALTGVDASDIYQRSKQSETEAVLERLNTQIISLQSQLERLERRMNHAPSLPETGLLSDNFMVRAFTVMGHYLAATMLVLIPLYCLATLLGR